MRQTTPIDVATWLALGCLLLVATILRLAFFPGFFGSDEVTYLAATLPIAAGEWPVSTYIGSLRYGVNIPTAIAIRWFGLSEFSANLWSLFSSVGEVALVFVLARLLWGIRAAVVTGGLLLTLPLHVNFAGRMSADAPLSFFMTASFVLFYIAEQRRSRLLYFLAGIAVGGVFWIKEVTTIFVLVFAAYAVVRRRWDWRWLSAVAGALLMVAFNCLLLWRVTGDPLYIFRTVASQVDLYVNVFAQPSEAWFYPRYLFLEIKHTWLLGYLFVAALALWMRFRARPDTPSAIAGADYVVLWGLGMLVVFSLMPISFAPFMLIAKAPNYMLMFAAPLCLLAGWFISRQRPAVFWGLSALWLAGSIPLAALEQQAIRVFTANSKATVTFAETHPAYRVYALSNGFRAGMYAAMLAGGAPRDTVVHAISDLVDPDATKLVGTPAKIAVVVDTETLGWNWRDPLQRLEQIPACWRRIDMLEPAGFGIGHGIAQTGAAILNTLGDMVPAKVTRKMAALVRPRPAYVYEVPGDCRELAVEGASGG